MGPRGPDLVTSGNFSADMMLEQADDAAAVAELLALKRHSDERHIVERSGPFSLGPTVDLSNPGAAQSVGAEAELVAGVSCLLNSLTPP